MGLKDEIRGTVETQLPSTVHKASTLAKIQQSVLERGKTKYTRPTAQYKQYTAPKTDKKAPAQPHTLWRDKQLRDCIKANGLCFNCGEKFVSGHFKVCTKRNKPQANASLHQEKQAPGKCYCIE